MPCAAFSSSSPFRAVIMTSHPISASFSAIARPMPRLPPVTMATLSCNRALTSFSSTNFRSLFHHTLPNVPREQRAHEVAHLGATSGAVAQFWIWILRDANDQTRDFDGIRQLSMRFLHAIDILAAALLVWGRAVG